MLLGLAAPAAFFSVTLRTSKASLLLVAIVAVLGGVGVLTTLTRALASESSDRVRIAATVWMALAVLIGARLMGTLGHTVGIFGGAS